MASEDDQNGGLSTTKVVAGAALGVAVPAAVGVAKKLMSGGRSDEDERGRDEDDDDDDARSEPTTRERRSTGRASKATKPATRTAAKARAKPQRTREQLYRQATRLKIDGRSSMNKAQLERAIEKAKNK